MAAIHNLGLKDTPRLFYVHFWATDTAEKLASALKVALSRRTARDSHARHSGRRPRHSTIVSSYPGNGFGLPSWPWFDHTGRPVDHA